MKANKYQGWFDIMNLRKLPIPVHLFYDEMPNEDERVLTIALTFDADVLKPDMDYSELPWEEPMLLTDELLWRDEIEIVNTRRVLLYWVSTLDIENMLESCAELSHHADLARCLVMRHLRNGGK